MAIIDGGGGGEGGGGGGIGAAVAEPFDPHAASVAALSTSYSTEGMPADLMLGREEREVVFVVDGQHFKGVARNKADTSDWVRSNFLASLQALRTGDEYRGTPPALPLRKALLQGDGDI